MMMNKNILYFLLGIVSTIAIEGIAIFIMLYDPSPGYREVSENDWNDDWENSIRLNTLPSVIFYSDRMYTDAYRYIIENFNNSPLVTKMVLSAIDTSEVAKNEKCFVWKFLWNSKYNHQWRVEEVNDNYINDVSMLFRISFLCTREKGLFIKDLNLFPSLSKKHTSPVKIEPGGKRNNTTYLRTDYKKGFDFFLWKDLQDYTKLLSEKNDYRGRYVLLNGSNKKELVTIEWFGEGYKIKLPKTVNEQKKMP